MLAALATNTCVCRLKVLDAKALGDPGVLGTAKVALAMLGLQANAGPRDVWLPLKVCTPAKRAFEVAQVLCECLTLVCNT